MTRTQNDTIAAHVGRTLNEIAHREAERDLMSKVEGSERGDDPPDTDQIVMHHIWGATFANPVAHYITPYYVATVTSPLWKDVTHTQRITRVVASFERLVAEGELRWVSGNSVLPTRKLRKRALDV